MNTMPTSKELVVRFKAYEWSIRKAMESRDITFTLRQEIASGSEGRRIRDLARASFHCGKVAVAQWRKHVGQTTTIAGVNRQVEIAKRAFENRLKQIAEAAMKGVVRPKLREKGISLFGGMGTFMMVTRNGKSILGRMEAEAAGVARVWDLLDMEIFDGNCLCSYVELEESSKGRVSSHDRGGESDAD